MAGVPLDDLRPAPPRLALAPKTAPEKQAVPRPAQGIGGPEFAKA